MRTEFCRDAIDWIKKTKEIIDFALQLQASIFHEEIRPQHILKEVCVESGSDDYFVNRDWTSYSDVLKEDFANAIKLNTVSYQVIILKESYAGLFDKRWAKRAIEPDLWAAQEGLKHIRNALGHLKAKLGEFEARATWNFFKNMKDIEKKEYPKKLEVIAINFTLDVENLDGMEFNWDQIGGIKSFINLLEYLIKDLEKRL